MCEIFADDISLFSKVIDKNISNSQLNSGLMKISKWAFQWEISFNPDPNKQGAEARFFNKCDKENYRSLQFNSTGIQIADSQKRSGLILDPKFNFNEHIESKTTKYNKIIGLMNKLSLILSGKNLLTIYKSIVRPNLYYANIIYNKPFNESLKRKIEMIQYNTALITTAAFKGPWRDKTY